MFEITCWSLVVSMSCDIKHGLLTFMCHMGMMFACSFQTLCSISILFCVERGCKNEVHILHKYVPGCLHGVHMDANTKNKVPRNHCNGFVFSVSP